MKKTPERHRLFDMQMGKLYPAYIAKAERKGRTAAEVDEVTCWLTGYTPEGLRAALESGATVEGFFDQAPQMHPARDRVKGVICGVRIEEIESPLMQDIRRLDKLVDELAKGRAMEKILRA